MRKTTAFIAVLILTAATLASFGAGHTQPGQGYFPPVLELLGGTVDGLPLNAKADLRDALSSRPSFKKSVRQLASRDTARRRNAVRHLARPGNVRAIPYLGGILLNRSQPERVRLDAAIGLGRIAHWRTLQYLRQAAQDPKKEIRFAATLALGRVSSVDTIKALAETSAQDSHWWVRYAAALALGESEQPGAVPVLSKFLESELRWQIRQQAARSLGRIGTRPAISALGKGLQDSDPAVRYSSARALGKIGGFDSLELLHAAYEREADPLPRDMMHASIKKVIR